MLFRSIIGWIYISCQAHTMVYFCVNTFSDADTSKVYLLARKLSLSAEGVESKSNKSATVNVLSLFQDLKAANWAAKAPEIIGAVVYLFSFISRNYSFMVNQ